jgi:hypothetical protein
VPSRRLPRHRAGVGEVLHPGDTGEGEASDVEAVIGVGAGQPHLLVGVGRFERAVRVTGEQRQPARRPLSADHPRVAAGAPQPLVVEDVGELRAHGQLRVTTPQLAGERREEHVVGVEDGQGRPLRPLPRGDAEGVELRDRCGVTQPVIHPCHVAAEERLCLAGQRGVGTSSGLDQPGLPGEPVPRHPAGTEQRRRPPLRLEPGVLELPGAIGRHRAALEERHLRDGARDDVRDPPRVATDLAGHRSDATGSWVVARQARMPSRPSTTAIARLTTMSTMWAT